MTPHKITAGQEKDVGRNEFYFIFYIYYSNSYPYCTVNGVAYVVLNDNNNIASNTPTFQMYRVCTRSFSIFKTHNGAPHY